VLAVGGTAVSAARGVWTHREYLMDDIAAYNRAAAAMVSLERCRVCFATTDAQVDWTWLAQNPTRDVAIEATTEGRVAEVTVHLPSDGRRLGFGRVQVHWGDGHTSNWTGVISAMTLRHTYDAPGDYGVDVLVERPSGLRRERVAIQVH
jgi:hypothetical protein